MPFPKCVVPVRPTTIINDDITVIILAANIGYGMKTYGPRSLLNINEKDTLLEHQISTIKASFPQSDIILVVGFKAGRIIKKCPPGVRIVENPTFEETNEAEQIRIALNCTITENAIIIKDNVVFNFDTFKDITQNGSCIIYDSKGRLDKHDIGVTIVNNYGTIFAYDIPTKWCHIVYLCGKDLKTIKALCTNKENSKLYLFELLNILLGKTDKIKAIEPKNMDIMKINTLRDWERLQI